MLKDRVKLARTIALFTRVVETDKLDRPKILHVPGHKGKTYRVIIRREMGVTVECHLMSELGNIPCQGNGNGTICYHSMAAIIAANNYRGTEAAICNSKVDANRLANLKHGRNLRVKSFNGNGEIWVVISKVKGEVSK